MITKEMTYKKAFEQKAVRLKEKQALRQAKLNEAYLKEPKIKEIEESLSRIGAELALTALSGDIKKLTSLKEQSQDLSRQKEVLLEKSGVKKIEYECDICRDTGYVSGKICDCVKREAAYILINELSKEMPLGNSKFDNFDLKYYSDRTDKNGENRTAFEILAEHIHFTGEKKEAQSGAQSQGTAYAPSATPHTTAPYSDYGEIDAGDEDLPF